MKFFIKYIFILFAATFFTSANAQKLSNTAQISLITCSSGNELYSTFGHTAIRVCDTAQNMDVVFNYGTFDFSTPNFYIKFSRGTLMYMLSAGNFADFLRAYKHENRSVYEQVLNLNQEQKEKLFDLIIQNYQPQNREYRYDFFKDNCATRVRDIFQKAVGRGLNFSDKNIENNKTFRQLIYPYLENMQWSKFGIDILLGMPTDARATNADYMFLPNELMINVDTAKVNGVALAQKAKVLYQAKTAEIQPLPSPNIVFYSLLVVVFFLSIAEYCARKNGKKFSLKFFDRIFFLALALLSVLIILMWIFSLHYPVRGNLNVLWLNPLYLYVFWKLEKSNFYILFVCLLCNIVVLCLHPILPQHFNTAFFAIILIATFRLIALILRKVKQN